MILLVFIDPLVNLVQRLVKDKQDKLQQVSYIDERFLQTPAVAIEQALRELHDMALLAKETSIAHFLPWSPAIPATGRISTRSKSALIS